MSLAVPAQTFVVASAAQAQASARDGFEAVYTPPPPPEPEPVETASPEPAGVVEPDPAAESDPEADPSADGGAPLEVTPPQGYSGADVIAYAEQFVGVVPYGYGNDPNDSFSCDGLVQYVFAAFGYSLPRGADSQASMGTVISPAEAQAGDLLWWPGQHIGIYDGAGGMIDSPDFGRFVEHRGIWGSPVYVRL